MTTDELIEYLKTFPTGTEIYYSDMVFGGIEGPLERYDLQFKDGSLILDSILWEEME